MADYYPLLARALEGLAENTPDARRQIYDRARTALGTQLRSIEPPLTPDALEREDNSLEEAIARAEAIHGSPPPAAVLADEIADPPAGIETAKAPTIRKGGKRSRSLLTAAALVAVIAPIAVLAFLWRDTPATTTAVAPPPLVTAPASRTGDAKFSERVGGSAAPAARPAPAPVPAAQPPLAAAPAPSATPAAPIVAAPAAAPVAPPAVAPTPPVASPAPTAAPSAPTVTAGQLAVAQRAMMGEQNPTDGGDPILTSGRVVWQLDTVNAGQGQRLQTVVRAKVDLPESALALDLTLQRNTDPALPSSHTLQVVFSSTRAGDPNRIVRDMTPPLLRADDNPRAVQLSGLSAPVKDNVFLVLLSGLRSEEERNEELLLRRNWLDLQIRFASGRRANLSIEKGVSGERVMDEAFRQWAQPR